MGEMGVTAEKEKSGSLTQRSSCPFQVWKLRLELLMELFWRPHSMSIPSIWNTTIAYIFLIKAPSPAPSHRESAREETGRSVHMIATCTDRYFSPNNILGSR